MSYRAVVIGASAGGLKAIKTILKALPINFAVPILIVQHLSPQSDNYMARHLNDLCKIKVKEANEKEKVTKGVAYIAPPNYHLLIEMDQTLSLTVEPKVSYSRPSIDVLFESAAYTYKNEVIGVILTGANNDGSKGLSFIKKFNGLAIVQEPSTAETDAMPRAAIANTEADFILTLEQISRKLIELVGDSNVRK